MYFFTQNIYDNYYYYIIIIAIVYFLLNKLNIVKLVSIIIVIFIFYYISTNIKEKYIENEKKLSMSNENLKNDIKDIKELNTENFYIKETSKNIKYLSKNNDLILIIKNIKFVKKFNKSRYTNMITNMDNLMKVYIYILIDRYDLNTFLPIFNDIRSEILEIFYSFIFVIPENFKHMYGFEPHVEINKSLEDFQKTSNKMLYILKKYGVDEKKNVFINIDKYKPYDNSKDLYLP